MTLVDLANLSKAELLHLVKRHAFIDQRDIDSARWEIASDDYMRLFDAESAAEREREIAVDASLRDVTDPKLLRIRAAAEEKCQRARAATERADRRRSRLWDRLQKHFLKDAK